MIGPGVYDSMTGGEYFEQSEWVSASKLKRHLPEHYYRPPSAARDALDFGSAFHTTVLGAGDPVYAVTASTWAGNEAKTQRATAYADGMTPVLEKELPRLNAMREAVLAHPGAVKVLHGIPECSVFAEVDGVRCKARFDLLDEKRRVGVDLKTTSAKPNEQALVRAVIDYGYDLQADHYLRTVSAVGVDIDRFVFVFVHTQPPHFVTVLELDETFYNRAGILRELALDRLLHPEMVDPYPGAQTNLVAECPRWARLGA